MTNRLLESAALRGTEGTSLRALEGSGSGTGTTYVKYRTFDGAGDNLTFNVAETAGQRIWNPGTAVICLRRTRDSAGGPGGGYQEWFSGCDSGTQFAAAYFSPTDQLDVFDGGTGSEISPTIKTADGWAVCVISRGATNGLRAHSYKYTEGVWQHNGPMGPASPNALLDATSYFEVSQQNGWNQWLAADVAAIAYWHRELSDTEVATLHTSLAAWSALSPNHLWRMDSSPITDSVGTSTIRTISGTTLTANDSALPTS